VIYYLSLDEAFDDLKTNTDFDMFPNIFRRDVNIAKLMNNERIFHIAQDMLVGCTSKNQETEYKKIMKSLKRKVRDREKAKLKRGLKNG
jgi:hypothetical protein